MTGQVLQLDKELTIKLKEIADMMKTIGNGIAVRYAINLTHGLLKEMGSSEYRMFRIYHPTYVTKELIS